MCTICITFVWSHFLYVSSLLCYHLLFFFKQKTAYEMRISDWSSDVCSSDLGDLAVDIPPCRVQHEPLDRANGELGFEPLGLRFGRVDERCRRGAGAVAHGNGGLQVLVGHIIDREVQSDAAIPELGFDADLVAVRIFGQHLVQSWTRGRSAIEGAGFVPLRVGSVHQNIPEGLGLEADL